MHVCWAVVVCYAHVVGWLAIATRQAFVLVYASVRACAPDGLAGQGRGAIVGGWFCIANRGDDNLVKNIRRSGRACLWVCGSCGVNHNKKSEEVITSLKNPHLTGHG